MQKKTAIKTIIFIILLVILFSGVAILTHYLNRIPDNPQGTVGNTAGNLYNKGYFCENQDVVYFANPYDNGCLYSMNADESNIKRIQEGNMQYINSAGKYVYYYDAGANGGTGLGYLLNATGFYRIGTKFGAKPICLHKTNGAAMALIDNAIYYQTYDRDNCFSLYKTQINGTGQTKLSDDQINPSNATNSSFYYNNTTSDFHLYCWNTMTDSATSIFNTDVYQPINDGDLVYFINMHDGYKLCRYHMSDGTIDTLTEDRVDLFNYYNGMIYYQTSGDETALKYMNADGSNQTVIANGPYSDINITSQYVYFHEFGSLTPMYKVPLGGTNMTMFEAAEQAAIANMKK